MTEQPTTGPLDRRRFLRDTAGNVGAFSVVKLRGLAMVVLVSWTLGVHQYGVWMQVIVASNVVAMLAGLGMFNALVRFYPDAADDRARRELLGSGLLAVAVAGIACSAAFFAAAPLLAPLFARGGEATAAFRVGALLIVAGQLRLFCLSWQRARDEIGTFSRWMATGEALDLLLAVTLLLALRSVEAALAGSAAAMLIVATVLGVRAVREAGGISVSAAAIPPLARYSLPLVPLALSDEALARSDRLVIGALLGPGPAGVYSAIYAFASLTSVIGAPLVSVFFPRRLRLEKEHPGRAARWQTKLSWAFAGIVAAQAVVLALAGPWLLEIVLGEPVREDHVALVFLTTAVGVGLYGLGRLASTTMYVAKRTGALALVWGGALVVNVALNLLLVPGTGILGGGLATVGAYAVFAAIQFRMSAGVRAAARGPAVAAGGAR